MIEKTKNKGKDKFAGYTAEDFIELDSFQNFVFNTNERDVLFWNDWIKRNPQNRPDIQLASEYLRAEFASGQTVGEKDVQAELEKLFFTIDDPSSGRGGTSGRATSKTQFNVRKIAAVASFIVAAASALLFTRWLAPATDDSASNGIVMIEKSNPRGQKLIFQLPDGSKVKLNAEGQLRFPQTFDENERTVHLRGEAYFDVVRDEERPFRVITENLEVRVLGTSFVVNAYPEELQELVVVESGKVEVTGKYAGSVLLYPEQMTRYNKASPSLAKAPTDPKFMGWKNEILYFEKASADELIKSLERWYDVEIEVVNPNNLEVSVSGEFKNQSLRNVLTGLGYSSGFDYQITKNQVKITIK
ncbi:MAG: DUF4974 domain-containing protein [Cyclobacteriaceae bacterium]